MSNTAGYTWAPSVHLLTKNKLYTSIRYNYEEAGAVSFLAGKTFEKTGTLNGFITPSAGLIAGTYHGVPFAVNCELEYNHLSFCSQAQYTMNTQTARNNFFYHWTDLSYRLLPWLDAGVAVQQTAYLVNQTVTNAGVMAEFASGKWRIPVYYFNGGQFENYMVIGINMEWDIKNKTGK